MIRKIHRANLVSGQLSAPASKSYAQRALLAHFFGSMGGSGGKSGSVKNIGNSNDALALQKALKELYDGANEINIGESGLACRLLSPCIPILTREVVINGHGSILSRSMSDMISDLQRVGISVKHNDGKLPITISGEYKNAEMRVNGSGGSQFISGLLFALPLCGQNTVLQVVDLKSKPYVDMTLDVLKSYGIEIINDNYEKFTIKGGQKYNATDYVVEGDWSSVGALLVAGGVCGEVIIGGLNRDSLQADRAILDVLEKVGAGVEWLNDRVRVYKQALKGFEFNATDCPDLFCAMVALAVSCQGVTKISGVDRLRNKESDRAITLMTEFNKMGANVSFEADVMTIVGGELTGAVVHSHNDHRIAMATAAAALNAKGETTILGCECVAKSYADFFKDLSKIVHYE